MPSRRDKGSHRASVSSERLQAVQRIYVPDLDRAIVGAREEPVVCNREGSNSICMACRATTFSDAQNDILKIEFWNDSIACYNRHPTHVVSTSRLAVCFKPTRQCSRSSCFACTADLGSEPRPVASRIPCMQSKAWLAEWLGSDVPVKVFRRCSVSSDQTLMV